MVPRPVAGEWDAAMAVALEEAALAPAHGDIPIGCVVVVGGRLVARRHNERERLGDPTAHAEVLAIRDAATAVGDGWRLNDATVVVTVEPCPMCAGAIVAARAARVVFGAPNPEAGSMGSLYHLGADPRLNHEVETIHGVRAEAASALLAVFFAGRRSGLGAQPPAEALGGAEGRPIP
jgi:tRNA(adenine34) deaminase